MYKMLGWSGQRIDAFKRRGGNLDMVSEWTKDTCPDEKTWKAAASPVFRNAVLRAKSAASLEPWAQKWRVRGFVESAGPYELKVTRTQNPFWPMIAYGASFEACLDLGVRASPEVLAHAVAVDMIGKGRASKAEVDAELRRRGVGDVDPLACRPFDMSEHPLRDVDLRRTPNSEAMRIAGPIWGGLAAIREKKLMKNDLELRDGRYARKRDMSELARFVFLASSSSS